jgi:hypothetical protein
MGRTVKAGGRGQSSQRRTQRSGRSRAPAKAFNPSSEVRIVPSHDSEGSETWDVMIAPSAMQKLATAAGVTEADLNTLRRPLELVMCQLIEISRVRAPSWPNRTKHLRATSSAVRRLEALLRPEWVSTDMGRFESRELKLQMLGSRGVMTIKTRADGKKANEWMRAASIVEGDVTRDVQGVARIRARLSTMIDRLEHARAEGRLRPPDGAADPNKQYVADCALSWWRGLGHADERSKNFIAFASILYGLAGFPMSPSAIRAQLNSAMKRRLRRRE